MRSRDSIFYENKFYHATSEGNNDDIIKAILSGKEDDKEMVKECPFHIMNLPDTSDDIEPVGEIIENDPVRATHEGTFMQQVREIGAKKERKPTKRLIEEISSFAEHCLMSESLLLEPDEPETFNNDCNGKNSEQWRQAMDSEYYSLIKSQTWELVPLPEGKTAIGTRWIYKIRHNADGSLDWFKPSLVANGYAQSKRVDYTEFFSPVARYSAIRLLLALANANDFEVYQMDRKPLSLMGQ